MHDFQTRVPIINRLIQRFHNLLSGMLPGLTSMSDIHLQHSLPHFTRSRAVTLRAMIYAKVINWKTTFRTLPHRS